MRALSLLTALTAVLASLTAAHAAVDDGGPGLVCQSNWGTDPTGEPDTQTGDLSGGPLVLTDSTTNLPGSGTLTCRVQVNVSNHTGTGPQVQGHGTGVVTAGPSQISFVATSTDDVFLCGEFTDDSDGTTYFWDDTNSTWSLSNTVDCGRATGVGGPPRAYPRGEVWVTSFGLGDTQVDYGEFDPPLYEWVCVPGSDSVTCTPPAATRGPDRNVCGTLTVRVSAVYPATGTSDCTADSGGAFGYSSGGYDGHGEARSDGTFPWTCSGSGAGGWRVHCTVGP